MGVSGREGKYGCSALPSLACAAVGPGEASSRWSAWELWHMGRGVNAAVVLGCSCSVTCLGRVIVPWLRAPRESPSLLFCGAHQHCCQGSGPPHCCAIICLPELGGWGPTHLPPRACPSNFCFLSTSVKLAVPSLCWHRHCWHEMQQFALSRIHPDISFPSGPCDFPFPTSVSHSSNSLCFPE